MDITVPMVVSTGIQETETATAVSTAVIMAATIIRERDRAACHSHAKKVNSIASKIHIPKGRFCSHSCIECVYWEPNNKDGEDRQYCSFWGTYVQYTKMYGCGGFRQFK